MLSFFFFNDTATTEIYTLSLHDALPIYRAGDRRGDRLGHLHSHRDSGGRREAQLRSEEHTSELQSLAYLVCRLLLEKKKHTDTTRTIVSAHGRQKTSQHSDQSSGCAMSR